MKFKIANEIRFFYDASMRYSSFFGSFVFWIFAVILFFILNEPNFAIKFIIGTIIAMTVEYATKAIYKKRRPDFNKVKPYSLFEKFQEGGSFPSGHSANIALFTMLLHSTFQMPYLTGLFIVISLLVGMSRIYLGRHYVKDVIAGYVLGVIVGFLISRI